MKHGGPKQGTRLPSRPTAKPAQLIIDAAEQVRSLRRTAGAFPQLDHPPDLRLVAAGTDLE